MTSVYRPIGDYALLGDGRTAALVARDGSIDWLPWPDFDSPTLFAALLDARRGGRFAVECDGAVDATRRYLPQSNVLETSFDGVDGRLTVTDLLTTGARGLLRILDAVEGRPTVHVVCTPRPGYGSRAPRLVRAGEQRVDLHDPEVTLSLQASRALELDDGRIHARWTLNPGERAWLLLGAPGDPALLLDETLAYWRAFTARLHLRGPHAAAMERSALVLKALSYAPSGALIAAPTTSLPDRRGGQRNWDYRYAWLHDVGFALWALDGVGASEEAQALFHWLCGVARGRHPATLHALYGVRGEDEPAERELFHLSGYLGARPVRIGNTASSELELDVFGELIDAVHTFGARFGVQIDELRSCRAVVDWVAHHWRDPDLGPWEVRSRRRAFVYSRAASWLALDRGLRLFSGVAEAGHWRRERDALYNEVVVRGYDARLGALVQAYDSRVLDASALRLPLIGFLPATDPRMVATVEQIHRRLMPDGLVRRYDDGAPEEPYTACTFWLVEVLALQGRAAEAEALFRHALSFANDLGLFAEEVDARSRRQWGNFPQAATHLAILAAAERLLGFGRGLALHDGDTAPVTHA